MDIVSHGLWGALAFGRKNRTSFCLAFAIGLAPDLFSFGVLWTAAMLGLSAEPDFSHGTPSESTIPLYVHHLYDVTHSLGALVRLLPHTLSVASVRLEVRRLAVEHPHHPHSELRGALVALCLVSLAGLSAEGHQGASSKLKSKRETGAPAARCLDAQRDRLAGSL